MNIPFEGREFIVIPFLLRMKRRILPAAPLRFHKRRISSAEIPASRTAGKN
jgi:hypothetical protein